MMGIALPATSLPAAKSSSTSRSLSGSSSSSSRIRARSLAVKRISASHASGSPSTVDHPSLPS